MRVALVHNPEAGSGDHSGGALVARLKAAGHDAVYASTEAESLTRALNAGPDVVMAAGGDGTAAAVARLLAASRRDIPLAILPIGTANNIARALGVPRDAADMVDALATARRHRLDVGMVRGAWGSALFVESAGVGVFAAMLRDASRESASTDTPANERERGNRFRKVLENAQARHWRVEADGEDLSGTYLLAVALNIGYVGASLALAPDADPADGRLDLLLVREEDRSALGDYLDGIAIGVERPLAIAPRRVTRVRLEWSAARGHVDDRLWPEDGSGKGVSPTDPVAEIGIEGPPLQVLIPA